MPSAMGRSAVRRRAPRGAGRVSRFGVLMARFDVLVCYICGYSYVRLSSRQAGWVVYVDY